MMDQMRDYIQEGLDNMRGLFGVSLLRAPIMRGCGMGPSKLLSLKASYTGCKRLHISTGRVVRLATTSIPEYQPYILE